MATTVQLPHWDMTVVFPGLDSPEFEAAFASVGEEVDSLGSYMDEHGIARQESVALDSDTIATFNTLITRLNDLSERAGTVNAYIHAFVSTDSRNTAAQARRSELQQQFVKLSQLTTRFTAWIGSLDVEKLIESSDLAHEHAFTLRESKIRATHLMDPALEDLVAEISPVAGSAWARLHNTVTSQILVPFEQNGSTDSVPMTVIRNLAHDPDREVRRRAHLAEIEAWKRVEVPLAAALNSIKGETNLLSERRGWESPLHLAVFNNNIDMQTLDAMMEAARASFPDFRRYLRAKAHALGIERCTWYDLFAPVSQSESEWDYEAGREFLVTQFRSYSDRLADFADRAYRENWIDAEPRPGKVGGAFCMGLRGDESRVLTNYLPSYDGVSTVAHELGHAYHNFCKANRTPLQRSTPMTLAETASIFCETIIRGPALQQASESEQIAILESSIQNSCQIVVDITSRFLFEKGVFERRQRRELSTEELCELMLDSQRQTYGDGLDENVLHPYMWAVKGHYYGHAFYNYPYMFGLLFGLGLYAQYSRDPESFKGGYDDLLSSTGMADAATLASRFGIDVRSSDFWTSSLDLIREDIDRFEELVGAKG